MLLFEWDVGNLISRSRTAALQSLHLSTDVSVLCHFCSGNTSYTNPPSSTFSSVSRPSGWRALMSSGSIPAIRISNSDRSSPKPANLDQQPQTPSLESSSLQLQQQQTTPKIVLQDASNQNGNLELNDPTEGMFSLFFMLPLPSPRRYPCPPQQITPGSFTSETS